MLTSELLDAHRDALKEEGTIDELLQSMDELNAEGKEEIAKITQLQADLDHEAVVMQGLKMERLQEESKERETLLKHLSEAREE